MLRNHQHSAKARKDGSMHIQTPHNTGVSPANAAPTYTSLDRETRAVIDTASAAHHLNRQPQTLRGWACLESGPIRPVRVHGRLAWKVAEIRRLLGVA